MEDSSGLPQTGSDGVQGRLLHQDVAHPYCFSHCLCSPRKRWDLNPELREGLWIFACPSSLSWEKERRP